MPTNQTENYQLSQWEKTDKVQMEDFNADNAKIDTALKAQADTLASVQSQLTRKGNCTVEVFTYAGTGSSTTRISFPRKPTAFIVTGFAGLLFGFGDRDNVFSENGPMGSGTWSGSTFIGTNMSGDQFQKLNTSGQTYVVTAFYAES